MTNSAPPATPDAIPDSWVDRAPAGLQPYLRLMRADRPVGVWLLFIPCLWGLALGALTVPDPQEVEAPILFYYATLMGIGAYAMRSAGCAYNDIVDRDYDAKVERTALRPIPSGQISAKQAWALLAGLCLVGLAVLVQFNLFTIVVGVSSLALVAAYPFMKRITWWPQAWLGLTFNWGALVGYAAVTGTLTPGAFALYIAGVFWTLGYDTIYAHQDTEDDALIGVKSSALRLGDATKPWLAGFYALTIMLFALAGHLGDASLIFFATLIPAVAHFAWQVRKLDIHDSHNCLTLFKSNRNAGLLLMLAPLCEVVVSMI